MGARPLVVSDATNRGIAELFRPIHKISWEAEVIAIVGDCLQTFSHETAWP
jgi:hypothetical protein